MDRHLKSFWGPLVCVVLVLATAALSDEGTPSSPVIRAPIPIVSPPPGWAIGPSVSNATIVLEVMLDLVCPDSARAWDMLHDLREAYDPEVLRIKVHIYQLPYHRNAYVLSQGFLLVEAEYPDEVRTYVDTVYAHLADFTNTNSTHLSDDDVIELLADIVSSENIMEKDEFKSKIGDYSYSVRLLWKYAARLGVAGTPWYFVNGVDLALDPNLTYDLRSWTTFVDEQLQ